MSGVDQLRCANCGAPHGPNDIFCERCGYDFITGSLPGPLEEFAAPPSYDPPTPSGPGHQSAPVPGAMPGQGPGPAPAPGAVPGSVPMPPAQSRMASAQPPPVPTPDRPPAAPVFEQPPPMEHPPPVPPDSRPPTTGGVRLEHAPNTGEAPFAAPSTQPTPALRIGGVTVDVAVHRAYFESVVSEGELSFPQPPPIPQRIELPGPEIHIGRTSQGRAIHPDLDLAALTGDPAVSSRHAVIRLEPSGTMTVTDVGSTNGTYISSFDGTPIAPGMAHLLLPGGVIFLGAWTALTVMLA